MAGELTTRCGTCAGTGYQTKVITQGSISSTTQQSSKQIPCQGCNGSGKVLGVPGTIEDIEAYAGSPMKVRDQIFDLAKKLQTARTVRTEQKTTIRKQRQVTVKKTRSVGGFLGIGSHDERYDAIETQYYDEPHSTWIDKTVQPMDIILKEWTDRVWGNDDPFQYLSTTGYKAMLTKSAEFVVMSNFTQNYEHKTNGANRFVAESKDWAPVGLASLDDFTVLFDFRISGFFNNPGWAEYEGQFEFPGPSGQAFRAGLHKGYNLTVTKLYEKGHGLLTLLQDRLAG